MAPTAINAACGKKLRLTNKIALVINIHIAPINSHDRYLPQGRWLFSINGPKIGTLMVSIIRPTVMMIPAVTAEIPATSVKKINR